jgi:hypothetical protein
MSFVGLCFLSGLQELLLEAPPERLQIVEEAWLERTTDPGSVTRSHADSHFTTAGRTLELLRAPLLWRALLQTEICPIHRDLRWKEQASVGRKQWRSG